MIYRLDWDNPGNGAPLEIDGFIVYRRDYDPIFNPVAVFEKIFDSRLSVVDEVDNYTDETANLNQSYEYAVSIIVGGQATPLSASALITAPYPTNLARTAKTTTTISISWTNPEGYPVDGFGVAVYNVTDDEGVFVAPVYVAPFNSYTITGLTAQKTYNISVRFIYGAEYSLSSNEITEQTPQADP